MNKLLNPDETPSELKPDLNSYSRVLENLIEGTSARHQLNPAVIARFFKKATQKVLEGFADATPTPPFPLTVKLPFELTGLDIIDEDVTIDTRVMEERTPSIPVEFDIEDYTPPDQRPTPNIFNQPTPTMAEDEEYSRLIALAVPNPDLTVITGKLPVYVTSDHELAQPGENNARPEVIFSFTPSPETMQEWTLSYAVAKYADTDTAITEPHQHTPPTESENKKPGNTPEPLDIDWSDLKF